MEVPLPPSVDAIKATIRAHRSRGQFLEGAQLIQSLPRDISSTTSVSIEIAQLYLVQGQYALAAQTCEGISNLQDSAQSEEAAAFKLLHAFIDIQRYSKLKTALRVAQRIGSAWKIEVAATLPKNASGDESDGLSKQVQGMTIDGTKPTDTSVTEYKVRPLPLA